ncbi:MAG: hypothetical protein AB7S48_06820 [Bacteroidales bacterium]
MKRNLLLVLLALTLIGSGCASKKYAKRGDKYEQAGMWELAAESYMQSLSAKRDNIDAIVGLKRSGQKVIDDRCYKIYKAYESDQLKEVVYGYLSVDDFRSKAAAFGVELTVSDMAKDYFNDAKPKYIEKVYAESQVLMEAEKFVQAENILKEIQKIEPNYGNVQEMLKVSKCEPLYRQGKEFMASGLNRKAYANFDKIIKEHSSYKDSKELMAEALQNALVTIKVDEFKYSAGKKEIAERLQSSVVSKLNTLNNPFIKVIDTENTQEIIDEQKRSVNVGSDVQIGRILGAKAILTASVVEFSKSEGRLKKTEKHGYLRAVKNSKNKITGEEDKKTTYKKVVYHTYNVKNTATISLKFQLLSIETGAVMVADIVRESYDDEVNYATFDGDDDKLVPGDWQSMSKDSDKDYISDNSSDVSAVRKLLKARKNVESIDDLINKAISEIAIKTAQKLNKYNPEQ